MLNYYQILELKDFAEQVEIKGAYRKKCMEYHPDRTSRLGGKLKNLAESEMVIINKAYDILGAPQSKAKFDLWLREAGRRNALIPCRHCGLHYESTVNPSRLGICPVCSEQKIGMDAIAGNDEELNIGAEELLANCFIVIHHFVASSTVRTFNPTVYMMVNGEAMIASIPQQSLELSISNRRKFDLVCSGPDVFKNHWNPNLGMGRITFLKTHPVDCAKILWDLCGQFFGKPVLEYCRLEINNENFKPYEHVLNQSVIVLAAEVSPWNASKLFSRHRRNLISAVNDPETSVEDPFISVMAGNVMKGNHDCTKADMDEKSHLLQSSLLATRENLSVQKRNIQDWNNQVEELLEQIAWLKKNNSELKEENAVLKEAGESAPEISKEVDELRKKIQAFESRNAELEKNMLNLSVLAGNAQKAPGPGEPVSSESQYNDVLSIIELLRKKNDDLVKRNNLVSELISLTTVLEEQNQLLMDQNQSVEDLFGKSKNSSRESSQRMRGTGLSDIGHLLEEMKSALVSVFEEKLSAISKDYGLDSGAASDRAKKGKAAPAKKKSSAKTAKKKKPSTSRKIR